MRAPGEGTPEDDIARKHWEKRMRNLNGIPKVRPPLDAPKRTPSEEYQRRYNEHLARLRPETTLPSLTSDAKGPLGGEEGPYLSVAGGHLTVHTESARGFEVLHLKQSDFPMMRPVSLPVPGDSLFRRHNTETLAADYWLVVGSGEDEPFSLIPPVDDPEYDGLILTVRFTRARDDQPRIIELLISDQGDSGKFKFGQRVISTEPVPFFRHLGEINEMSTTSASASVGPRTPSRTIRNQGRNAMTPAGISRWLKERKAERSISTKVDSLPDYRQAMTLAREEFEAKKQKVDSADVAEGEKEVPLRTSFRMSLGISVAGMMVMVTGIVSLFFLSGVLGGLRFGSDCCCCNCRPCLW